MRLARVLTVGTWDSVGMAASSLCILHCALTPLVIGFLPALGSGFLAGEEVHQALALILIGIAALAFVPSYREHHQKAVLGLMAVGLALLLSAAFGEGLFGKAWAGAFTIAGGSLLVAAHWLNRSFCQLCRACRSEAVCCGEEGR